MPKSFHPTRLALAITLALSGISAHAASDLITFTIKSESSQKLVDAAGKSIANGTRIDQYAPNGQLNQRWQIELIDAAAGDYRISSALPGGGVLDTTWNAGVQRFLVVENGWSNSPSQKWRLNVLDGKTGKYEFFNRGANQCLDVPDLSTANSVQLNLYACNKQKNQAWFIANLAGVPLPPPVTIRAVNSNLAIDISQTRPGVVQQYTPHNGANQQWHIIPAWQGATDDYFIFNSAAKQVIDIQDGSVKDQALVKAESISSTWTTQTWRVEDVGNGKVRFVNKTGGKCLDVPAFSSAIETQLMQYPCNGGTNQQFVLAAPGSVTAPPVTSAPPPVTAPAPTFKNKRGGGLWYQDGGAADKALAHSKVHWYYNWNKDHNGFVGNDAQGRPVEYVPTIDSCKEMTDAALAEIVKANTSPYILTWTEPDGPGPGACTSPSTANTHPTPSQAVEFWPKLLATGKKIGAPCVVGGAEVQGKYLDQFMNGLAARNLPGPAFICLHKYPYATTDADAAVRDVKAYLERVHAKYPNLPIWITEYSQYNYDTNVGPTEAAAYDFMGKASAMMESTDYVQRYSHFAFFGFPGFDGNRLYNSDGTPTSLGVLYSTLP